MLLHACCDEPGSTRAAFRRGAGRVQDAAGTKNGKSDWYIPRYTKLNRVYTKIYLEKRRSIPRYTQLTDAIPSYNPFQKLIENVALSAK